MSDRIAELEAENARLRAVLRPFADLDGLGIRLLASSELKAFDKCVGLTLQIYRPDWSFGNCPVGDVARAIADASEIIYGRQTQNTD